MVGGLFGRLRAGLARTRETLLGKVETLLQGRTRIDEDFLESLEEVLIGADFGLPVTQRLVAALRKRAKGEREADPDRLRAILAEEVAALLPPQAEWQLPSQRPAVLILVGVNGVGKTTTIGKLAAQFIGAGKKVVIGAGDTFRAAAAEQLQIWGERAGADVIRHAEGADPGAVAFDAARAASYNFV